MIVGSAFGVGSALAPDDVLLTTYREQGALMMRGVTMKELFLYWSGDERGSLFCGAGPRAAETMRP